MVDSSLAGVIAAQTAVGHVDGQQGYALVRGYPLPELAAACSYEDVARLVLHGELPDATERARFAAALRDGDALTSDELRAAALLAQGRPACDALAAAMVLCDDSAAQAAADPLTRAERVLGRVPSVCAAVAGVAAPDPTGSYARRSLAALGSTRDDAPALHALETLLVLESEHGLSASTFACRVAASSGAGAGVALAAATATLSGPRHGGATAEALALLEQASASGDVAAFVRERHAQKARLPGFGHRIYKVRDPRLEPLRAAIGPISARLFPVAEALRAAAEPLYGPKGVYANIDLYSAVLLDALGVAPAHFVAAFTLGIASGWLAHWVEQRTTGRLVRPDSEYVGPPRRALP